MLRAFVRLFVQVDPRCLPKQPHRSRSTSPTWPPHEAHTMRPLKNDVVRRAARNLAASGAALSFICALTRASRALTASHCLSLTIRRCETSTSRISSLGLRRETLKPVSGSFHIENNKRGMELINKGCFNKILWRDYKNEIKNGEMYTDLFPKIPSTFQYLERED